MKAFIHISDLHVTAKERPGMVKNERINNTYLIAQEDKENNNYIYFFCDFVKKRYPDVKNDFYLLISGDIADSSYEIEYQFARKFIDQILKELNIEKDRVLIVPGNHDVDWDGCKDAAKKDINTPAHLQFAAKYGNFKKFYDDFYAKSNDEKCKVFDVNRQIVDFLPLDDEQILFVGINTNYNINYMGGSGGVDQSALRDELNELCDEGKYKDYQKIAVFHHNIKSDANEGSLYGDWKESEWVYFTNLLSSKGFKLILFGNEHMRASSKQLEGAADMSLSDCGSFAIQYNDSKLSINPSFKIYIPHQYYCEESNTDKKVLLQDLFQLIDKGRVGVPPFGIWHQVTNDDVKELNEFTLIETRKDNLLTPKTIKTLPSEAVKGMPKETRQGKTSIPALETSEGVINSTLSEDGLNTPVSEKTNEKHIEISNLNDVEFQKEMINTIKSEHLYHPGHFHWGRNSRSHNWIDTISLLNKRKNINLVQGKIYKLVKEIEEKKRVEYDVIIGVGMEGNIMSTQLLLEDIPYVYLPYTDRDEEFVDFNKRVCNGDGRYKNVLIITDVVNRGRMLKSLIEEKVAVFFSKVEQIHVVSLFYTGNSANKIMPVELRGIKDKAIEFYSLIQLEFGDCPYKDENFKECTIYKENLCEVYEFYSEK